MRQQDSSEGAADRTTVKPGFLSGRSIARHAKNSNGKDRPCSQNNPTMPLPNLLIVRHLNKMSATSVTLLSTPSNSSKVTRSILKNRTLAQRLFVC
jgi:hypothetical protein